MLMRGKGVRLDLQDHEVKYLGIILTQAKKRITNNKRREKQYSQELRLINCIEEKINELHDASYIKT